MRQLVIILIFICVMSNLCLGQDSHTQIAQIEQRIYDCTVKIQKLQSQEEEALDQLRLGLFCSECGRSKSEIERTGESFESHLQRVHGHAVATQAMLDNKRAFYESQIAQLRQQIAQLQQMKLQLVNTAQQQASLQRQQQEQQKQLEAQRQYLQQLEAQQKKLQQQRDRIVNQANAKAQSYQQAGQAAADGIKQVGDLLQQKMEQDSAARQLSDLQDKIQKQQQKMGGSTSVSTESQAGNDGSLFQLPPEVPIKEPANEDQIARGQADNPAKFGLFDSMPATDKLTLPGASSGHNLGDTAAVNDGGATFQPPQNLSDLVRPETSGSSGDKPTPTALPTPADDALAKLQQMEAVLDISDAKSGLEDKMAKQQAAIDMLRNGAQNDIPEHVEEGVKNANTSENLALAKLVQGGADVGAEFLPTHLKAAYKGAQAAAAVIPPGNDAAQNTLNDSKAAYYLNQSGVIGTPDDNVGLKKLNAAAGVVINFKNGDYIGSVGSAATVAGNGTVSSSASIVKGGFKMYEGAQGIAQAQQLKQDAQASGQAYSAGLLSQANEIRVQLDQNAQRVRELQAQEDAILQSLQNK